MIKFPEARDTDFQNIEKIITSLRSPAAIRKFYVNLIERYTKLNEKYQFSESFEPNYVFKQLDDNQHIRDRKLFGIPFGIKDVFNTKLLPTSMGSEIWKGFHAGNNARIVDEIADRGGIIFSKTTTAEFSVHYIQNGRTINPYDPARITGTSSAGSAVAVACGALPICLGTQTAGSIVRPASFCGVYGFKPSFGAIDRTGCLKTSDTLDTIGFLGSDIYGLRRTFLATFQKEAQYPFAQNYFRKLKNFSEKAEVRVGVIDDQFTGFSDYDGYVKRDFGELVGRLAGPDIELLRPQGIEFINDVHALHEVVYCKSLSYYFDDEYKRSATMSQIMTDMISRGRQISVDQYIHALHRQPEYRAKFDAFFASFDFLVTPATASVAPLISRKENDLALQAEKPDTCLIWSFFGYPVMSIPAFWSDEHNLPFGLQIVAPKFGDLALLEFGKRIVDHLKNH